MAGTLDAVLFDAFGTLFAPVSADSPAAHLCRLLASDGVSVPVEFAGRAILAELELYRAKFPHIRDEQELRQLEHEASDLVLAELELRRFPRDRMRQHLLDLFKMTVYPDAESALGQLRQRGLALGVVSNYNALLRAHLAELGLEDWFSAIVSSADFGEAKPHPGIFLEGVKQLGASPEQVLFVGDDLQNDYYGAQQVGLHAVLLNRDSAPVPKGVRAIATLNELPGLLGQHFS